MPLEGRAQATIQGVRIRAVWIELERPLVLCFGTGPVEFLDDLQMGYRTVPDGLPHSAALPRSPSSCSARVAAAVARSYASLGVISPTSPSSVNAVAMSQYAVAKSVPRDGSLEILDRPTHALAGKLEQEAATLQIERVRMHVARDRSRNAHALVG